MGDATVASWRQVDVHRATLPKTLRTGSSFRRIRFTRWPATREGRHSSITTNLSKGIVNAQRSVSSYYIIGYYTHAIGARRPVSPGSASSSTTAPTAKLDYRQGYFADKEFSQLHGNGSRAPA